MTEEAGAAWLTRLGMLLGSPYALYILVSNFVILAATAMYFSLDLYRSFFNL